MIQKINDKFQSLFGHGAALFASPGRVNLIGDHTDYNLGFVLPGAIDKRIYAAIRPASGDTTRLYSYDYDAACNFTSETDPTTLPDWAKYAFGVVAELGKAGYKVGAFDCVFGGDVPLGAGLSSSAALESVIGFGLSEVFGLNVPRVDLARIGQACEHNYVGVNCGIMDQFASMMGAAGKLIKLDCRSLDYTLIPFDIKGYRVVLIDSMVKHSLASSEYNVRRAQCEAGVAVIHSHIPEVMSLRDVTIDMLDDYRTQMDATAYRRCRCVIEENARVTTACSALESADYHTFGQMMFASHDGLSHMYEVSCEELDMLATTAINTRGVIGARMMGGGFGGCTINLVEDAVHDGYIYDITHRFERRFGIRPRIIDVVIGDGATRVEI